ALARAATHYPRERAAVATLTVRADAPRERPGKPDAAQDATEYRIVHVRKGEHETVKPGRHLVDEAGHPVYRADVPIDRQEEKDDLGHDAPKGFTEAPQPALFANIIQGILGGTLEWALIITGVMIA